MPPLADPTVIQAFKRQIQICKGNGEGKGRGRADTYVDPELDDVGITRHSIHAKEDMLGVRVLGLGDDFDQGYFVNEANYF